MPAPTARMATALERSGSSLAARVGLPPRDTLFVAALGTDLSLEERAAFLSALQAGTSLAAVPPVNPSAAQHAPQSLRAVLQGAAPGTPLAAPTTLHFSRGWSVAQFLLQVQRAYGTPALAQLRDAQGGAVHELAAVAPADGSGAVSPSSGAAYTLVPADTVGEPAPAGAGLVAAALRRGARGAAALSSVPSAGGSGWGAGWADPLYATLAAATAPAVEVAEYRLLGRAVWGDFRLEQLVATTGAWGGQEGGAAGCTSSATLCER